MERDAWRGAHGEGRMARDVATCGSGTNLAGLGRRCWNTGPSASRPRVGVWRDCITRLMVARPLSDGKWRLVPIGDN